MKANGDALPNIPFPETQPLVRSATVERMREYFLRHFEGIMILTVLVVMGVLNHLITRKVTMLNLYYFPVLLTAYVMGRRKSLLMGLFCIVLVSTYALINYRGFWGTTTPLLAAFDIITWASLLILTAAVVGALYEERQRRIQELRQAYIGVLEILSKYLESHDRYTKGHSLRVAEHAMDIAQAMGLAQQEVENIRVAGLLHDIGKVEVSGELIRKAASLSQTERDLLDQHTEKGARLLSAVGEVLREAVPIVLNHHIHFGEEHAADAAHLKETLLGARVVAVADAFDAMVTDRPYRAGIPPWKAMEELEQNAGTQFDPEVVKAFRLVLRTKIEKM